jgi:hypothetical protein
MIHSRLGIGLVLGLVIAVFQVHAVPNQATQREFRKSWDLEKKSLEHQAAVAVRQHKNAQRAQTKEWRGKERSARHSFFSKHLNGKERREYVQGYLARKDAFEKQQDKAAVELNQRWATRRKAFKERRMNAEIQFNAAVLEKRDAPLEVWPNAASLPANDRPKEQAEPKPSPGTPEPLQQAPSEG